MVRDTLQIATFGQNTKGILVGIQNFPTAELVLLHYEKDSNEVRGFLKNIRMVLGISTISRVISSVGVVESVINLIDEVIRKERDNKQILINVGSGNITICSAALLAAYLNGIKAFGIDENDNLFLYPLLKLSCSEVVSDTKVRILQALDIAGGTTENLEQLSKISRFCKPLLSYHINGSETSEGLIQLGFIDEEKMERSRSKITLNILGRIFLSTHSRQEKFGKNMHVDHCKLGPEEFPDSAQKKMEI